MPFARNSFETYSVSNLTSAAQDRKPCQHTRCGSGDNSFTGKCWKTFAWRSDSERVILVGNFPRGTSSKLQRACVSVCRVDPLSRVTSRESVTSRSRTWRCLPRKKIHFPRPRLFKVWCLSLSRKMELWLLCTWSMANHSLVRARH